jgi:hypothetical protein
VAGVWAFFGIGMGSVLGATWKGRWGALVGALMLGLGSIVVGLLFHHALDHVFRKLAEVQAR